MIAGTTVKGYLQDEFICKLTDAMIEEGVNATELAKRLGVSKQLISQIKNKKRMPSVATIYRIALALDVPVSDLYPKGNAQ